MNIGGPVTATDPDDDPLTYTLAGTDAEAFDIDHLNRPAEDQNAFGLRNQEHLHRLGGGGVTEKTPKARPTRGGTTPSESRSS